MTDRPKLKAILRPVHVGALALGCIIGFACFVLAGDLLAIAGPIGASSGVVIGGLAMLVIARSYGVMVRLFPVAGAEFAYAYHIAGRHHRVVCVENNASHRCSWGCTQPRGENILAWSFEAVVEDSF